MTKQNDLSRKLREHADALIRMADELDGKDVKVDETPVKAEPIPLERVRAVLADKSRLGHTAEVKALLQKYGAAKLSEVKPEQYPKLLAEAEALK